MSRTRTAVLVALLLSLVAAAALVLAGAPNPGQATPAAHVPAHLVEEPRHDELVGRRLVRTSDGAACVVVSSAGDIDCGSPEPQPVRGYGMTQVEPSGTGPGIAAGWDLVGTDAGMVTEPAA